jgi:hypothetical protein
MTHQTIEKEGTHPEIKMAVGILYMLIIQLCG